MRLWQVERNRKLLERLIGGVILSLNNIKDWIKVRDLMDVINNPHLKTFYLDTRAFTQLIKRHLKGVVRFRVRNNYTEVKLTR